MDAGPGRRVYCLPGPIGVRPLVVFVAQLTGQRIYLFRAEIARRFRLDLLEPRTAACKNGPSHFQARAVSFLNLPATLFAGSERDF